MNANLPRKRPVSIAGGKSGQLSLAYWEDSFLAAKGGLLMPAQ